MQQIARNFGVLETLVALVTATLLAACGTQKTITPTARQERALEYMLRIDPSASVVRVSGLLTGASLDDIESWRRPEGDYLPSMAPPDSIVAEATGVRFAYTIPIEEKPQANSTEPVLDAWGLRAWGWSLFATPRIPHPIDRIRVRVVAPEGWALASDAAADATTLEVGSLRELRQLAITVGDFDTRRFTAADRPVTLVVRRGHPVGPSALETGLRALIEAAAAYLGPIPAERISFTVDVANGKQRSAPGNNAAVPRRSSTVFTTGDHASSHDADLWGALAHEFVHTWTPNAFGDLARTNDELGPFFAEGFTDYLGYRIAHAAGLLDREAFEAALNRFYAEYLFVAGPGREKNAAFIPYRQGLFAALILDIELLRRSEGQADLGDVIRALTVRHAHGEGLTRDMFSSVLAELGGPGLDSLLFSLQDSGSPIDLRRHLAGSGIAVDEVENARVLIRRVDAGERVEVLRFQPMTEMEKQFLERLFRRPR